jgi:predicted O-methyltransferase YrrM
MQTLSDKPKRGRPKKIVTTATFNEVARHGWNSEPDVCQFIGSLIKMNNSANVLEIGVFEGETAVKMIEALPYGGKYTGIDINNYLKYNLKSFGTDVEFILGESITLLKGYPANHFDFIFVDGDHSWENILPEFKEVERVLIGRGITMPLRCMTASCRIPGLTFTRHIYSACAHLTKPMHRLSISERTTSQQR